MDCNTMSGVWTQSDKAIAVAVHSAKDPSDAEWDQYLDHSAGTFYHLILSDGGAPNPVQREKAIKRGEGVMLAQAIVSDSFSVRGVVTLFTWFRRGQLKAFSPKQAREILAYINISLASVRGLMNFVDDLSRKLDRPSTTAAAFHLYEKIQINARTSGAAEAVG